MMAPGEKRRSGASFESSLGSRTTHLRNSFNQYNLICLMDVMNVLYICVESCSSIHDAIVGFHVAQVLDPGILGLRHSQLLTCRASSLWQDGMDPEEAHDRRRWTLRLKWS